MKGARVGLSYANVVATLALFLALGGTSFAVLHVGSDEIADNSLRSRDIRNGTVLSRDIRNHSIRAADVRSNSLGAGVIKESSLGTVPTAIDANRLNGATAQDLRMKCPGDTVKTAGVCIETARRSPQGFFTALNHCDNAGRALVTMPQLDPFVQSHGPLPEPEWTASVYRNAVGGGTSVDQLETVLLGGGAVSYEPVYSTVQHAFRCVALPSN